jgi:hypothetical protein
MSWKAGKLKTLAGWRVQGACVGEGPVEIRAVMICLWGETMYQKIVFQKRADLLISFLYINRIRITPRPLLEILWSSL